VFATIPDYPPPYGEVAVSLPDDLAQGQQKRALMLIISGVLLQVSNTIMSWNMVRRLRNKLYINQKDNGFASARALCHDPILATAKSIDPSTGVFELV
jgi:hypothetical protein